MRNVGVTLTLNETLIERAREISGDDLGKLAGELIEAPIEKRDRRPVRDELIAGYVEEAGTDLELVEAIHPL